VPRTLPDPCVTDLHHGSIVTLWRSFPPLRLAEFALGVAVGRLYLSPG